MAGYQTGVRISSQEMALGPFCHFLHVNLRHAICLAEAWFQVYTTEMISVFCISLDFIQVMPPLCTRQWQNWGTLQGILTGIITNN